MISGQAGQHDATAQLLWQQVSSPVTIGIMTVSRMLNRLRRPWAWVAMWIALLCVSDYFRFGRLPWLFWGPPTGILICAAWLAALIVKRFVRKRFLVFILILIPVSALFWSLAASCVTHHSSGDMDFSREFYAWPLVIFAPFLRYEAGSFLLKALYSPEDSGTAAYCLYFIAGVAYSWLAASLAFPNASDEAMPQRKDKVKT